MDSDVKTLRAIRSSVARAAASCNANAKLVVQATSDLIALRKHRRRSFLARLTSRLR